MTRYSYLSPSSLSLTALRKAFDSFDTEKTGSITGETIATIMRMMGVKISEKNLQEAIAETDEDGGFQLSTWRVESPLDFACGVGSLD